MEYNYNKKNNKGVTLIEALFILGIMAILIGIIILLYARSNERTKSQQLINEVNQIIFTIKSLSQDQPTYDSINSTTIAESGYIEKKYISNNQVIDPWGGQIVITPYGENNGPNTYIALNFYLLSRVACQQIGVMDFSGIAKSLTLTDMREDKPYGFSGIEVNENCQQNNLNYVNIRMSK